VFFSGSKDWLSKRVFVYKKLERIVHHQVLDEILAQKHKLVLGYKK
jgi:hypothetical protein